MPEQKRVDISPSEEKKSNAEKELEDKWEIFYVEPMIEVHEYFEKNPDKDLVPLQMDLRHLEEKAKFEKNLIKDALKQYENDPDKLEEFVRNLPKGTPNIIREALIGLFNKLINMGKTELVIDTIERLCVTENSKRDLLLKLTAEGENKKLEEYFEKIGREPHSPRTGYGYLEEDDKKTPVYDFIDNFRIASEEWMKRLRDALDVLKKGDNELKQTEKQKANSVRVIVEILVSSGAKGAKVLDLLEEFKKIDSKATEQGFQRGFIDDLFENDANWDYPYGHFGYESPGVKEIKESWNLSDENLKNLEKKGLSQSIAGIGRGGSWELKTLKRRLYRAGLKDEEDDILLEAKNILYQRSKNLKKEGWELGEKKLIEYARELEKEDKNLFDNWKKIKL